MSRNLFGTTITKLHKESWQWEVPVRITIPNHDSCTNTMPLSYLFDQVFPNQVTWINVFERNNYKLPHPELYKMEALRFHKRPAVSALNEKVSVLLSNFKRLSMTTSRPTVVHLVLYFPYSPREDLIYIPLRREEDDTQNRRALGLQRRLESVEIQQPSIQPSTPWSEVVIGGETSNQVVILQHNY